MELGIQQGRPPRNLDLKVSLFNRFVKGETLEEVKATAGVPEYVVYESYRAFQIAQKSNTPIDGPDRPGGDDESRDEMTQESRMSPDNTCSSVAPTSGDKAS